MDINTLITILTKYNEILKKYITKNYADTALSDTSTNFVQNKVIKKALDEKVNVEENKGLSTNDLTNSLKSNYDNAYTHSQEDHAPANAQANIIETIKVNNSEVTASNKTVNISVPVTTSTVNTSTTDVPTANAVKAYVDAAVAGASNYLGIVTEAASLSTSAKKGDFYRVGTAWATGLHVGDILIAEKDSPSATVDNTNWYLLHNELNTDTWRPVQDNLTSESSTDALSAKQGKVLKDALDEVKKSASDGKSSIASAITNQGVTTAADATYATMSTNIGTVATNKYNEGYSEGQKISATVSNGTLILSTSSSVNNGHLTI